MIHVCYGLYDRYGRYSKFTGTSMQSMFVNTKAEVTVHIFHDNTLMEYNRVKFQNIAKYHKQQVEFYNVEELCTEKFTEFKTKIHKFGASLFSIACLYRLLIPDLLYSDKAIYLDSDTIVNLDINELWQIELEDAPFAAITEAANGADSNIQVALCKEGVVATDKYFNSGVLLMNLGILRESYDKIKNGLTFISEHQQYKFFDQDLLNYCFANAGVMHLPVKFNRFVNYARFAKEEVQNYIYHYIGHSADFNMTDSFNRLFMMYFMRTPFFGISTMTHIYEYLQALHTKAQDELINFTSMINDRRRVFCVELKNLDKFKEIFKVGRDDKIINATRPDAFKHLVNHMRHGNGKFYYILLVQDYDEWKEALMKFSFLEDSDFFNATKFFSQKHGMPLDTAQLIQAI